jgi:hypothetical protein
MDKSVDVQHHFIDFDKNFVDLNLNLELQQ